MSSNDILKNWKVCYNKTIIILSEIMSIKVNTEKCIGCGRCTEICPDTFNLTNEGHSEVISQDNLECAKKAADQCPVEAIDTE